jgi:hypothetical protein
MSWLQVAVCDGCKRQKGEGNHWILWLLDGTFLGFAKWDDELAMTQGHLCSQQCANKMLEKHLERKPEPVLEAVPEERTYEAISEPKCEFCGPGCAGGSVHALRVATGDYRIGGTS